MPAITAPVLVTGATGKQGGATARALLASGIAVRALVRDPATGRAKAIAAAGAELVTGDLFDRASIARAAEGARAVFSVQTPATGAGTMDFDGELAQAINLIESARTAGVPQFVHTSVSGAGQHTETPGWAEGRWTAMAPYWIAKTQIQDRVREAGFTHWTIIKPGAFMENFLPSAGYMFPRGIEGGLVTVQKPETWIPLVAVDDIGRAAAAAIADPDRFDRVELELASDHLTMADIAKTLSRALGVELTAPDMTAQEAIAAGMSAGMVVAHDFMNAAPIHARPEYARALGIPLTTFEEWTNRYLRLTP